MIIKKGEKIDSNVRSTHESKAAGNLSLAVAILTAVIFLLLVLQSAADNADSEKISAYYAMNLTLSVCGMIVSAISAEKYAGCYRRATTALVINTLMFIIMVSVFFIGL